jgi:ferritin-like metal-binding protein YciE
MKLLSLKIHSLSDVFIQELRDIYSSENQLVDSLSKLADAATSAELKEILEEHLGKTRGHVARLERIFEDLGLDPSGENCESMEGIISEAKDYISAEGNAAARDAGLIAVAQKMEHHEIAAYGTLRSFARHLNQSSALELLQQTLDEEAEADQKLTALAEKEINAAANMKAQ